MREGKEQKLLVLLKEEWQFLESSVSTLLHSLYKCRNIGIKESYSFEEQESFDSLTSKFGRTADLFTQRILRKIWTMLHELFVPFIDLINNAVKFGLIYSADQVFRIRDLRNQIAHEYIPEDIHDLVPEVMEMTEELVTNINCTQKFIHNRNWI